MAAFVLKGSSGFGDCLVSLLGEPGAGGGLLDRRCFPLETCFFLELSCCPDISNEGQVLGSDGARALSWDLTARKRRVALQVVVCPSMRTVCPFLGVGRLGLWARPRHPLLV